MSTPESGLQDLLDELSQLRAQNAMLKEKHFGSQKHEPLSEDEYINEESGYNRSDWWE